MNLAETDHLLTTTRSVRKRLDLGRPVEMEVIEQCIDLSLQAPIASNEPTYHFMLVTDADKRAEVAGWYRKAFTAYAGAAATRASTFEDRAPRLRSSAQYLADHMHEVPVLVIPCVEGKVEGAPLAGAASTLGTILPAAWSLMLALRSRGLGSAWTTLHLVYWKEVAEALGIPDGIVQSCLLPVAYYTGDDFRPAKRIPAAQRTYYNGWDNRRES